MAESKPCIDFVPPKNGRYAAFCERCHFSRSAHERWEQWEKEAAARAAEEDA